MTTYHIGTAMVPFYNHANFCVGTGRMGLALQKEYQEQLQLVQEKIGFQYIRGHGLFSDDMAIYQEYQDTDGTTKVEYNFTYLDLVMDSYRTLGIRPFLELGFMPERLASGTQTVFYWNGNVTPPKSSRGWADLVQATLRHLMERYGADEVLQWPIEVWNEPNLAGFWKDADMEAYFSLFAETFAAVKEVDARFRVGGPAICGVDDERWMEEFLKFCDRKKIPLDFVTRHHYTSEPPEVCGHYGYTRLSDPDEGFKGLHRSREIVDQFEAYRGAEIHLTEFNTSYVPNAPIHDTNYNAAYIAYLLSRLGDDHASYSYWTFGDIFEEFGVPFTPFHGGFGLVANGKIPKPTFWTFAFYKDLVGVCVHRSREAVIMKGADGSYRGVLWNLSRTESTVETICLNFLADRSQYVLLQKTVDEECCNPLKLWHDMGEPAYLSEKQTELLKEAAQPLVTSKRLVADSEQVAVTLKLKPQAVVYFEMNPICGQSDRGYDYERVMSLR